MAPCCPSTVLPPKEGQQSDGFAHCVHETIHPGMSASLYETCFRDLFQLQPLLLKRQQGLCECLTHLSEDLRAAKIVVAAIGGTFEGLPVFG